jgi:hypothetical protein
VRDRVGRELKEMNKQNTFIDNNVLYNASLDMDIMMEALKWF